ncbi:hypothetical protein [Methylobacterium nigriterrae]|uniref:hypothetical protein n=1 Tax=Methylobacterium nigriterrae TaxID=3127512 RepID=UPI003013329E
MLLIVFSAFIGAPITTALLWGHGAVEAILAAPFGGSLAGLCAAALIGFRHEVRTRMPRQMKQVHAYFSPTWTAPAHC